MCGNDDTNEQIDDMCDNSDVSVCGATNNPDAVEMVCDEE
jgi:hypothetical protein